MIESNNNNNNNNHNNNNNNNNNSNNIMKHFLLCSRNKIDFKCNYISPISNIAFILSISSTVTQASESSSIVLFSLLNFQEKFLQKVLAYLQVY